MIYTKVILMGWGWWRGRTTIIIVRHCQDYSGIRLNNVWWKTLAPKTGLLPWVTSAMTASFTLVAELRSWFLLLIAQKCLILKRSILMTHNLDAIVNVMDIMIETRDLPTSGDSTVSCYWVGAWVSRFWFNLRLLSCCLRWPRMTKVVYYDEDFWKGEQEHMRLKQIFLILMIQFWIVHRNRNSLKWLVDVNAEDPSERVTSKSWVQHLGTSKFKRYGSNFSSNLPSWARFVTLRNTPKSLAEH